MKNLVGLTVTKVVFECLYNGEKLVKERRLTVTKVVFESW